MEEAWISFRHLSVDDAQRERERESVCVCVCVCVCVYVCVCARACIYIYIYIYIYTLCITHIDGLGVFPTLMAENVSSSLPTSYQRYKWLPHCGCNGEISCLGLGPKLLNQQLPRRCAFKVFFPNYNIFSCDVSFTRNGVGQTDGRSSEIICIILYYIL
jgi:hypothetical protein